MTQQPYLLGLDLGGTSVKAVAVTPEGERLAKLYSTFNLLEPMAFAKAVGAAAAKATAQFGRPQHIGLSAPGIAARDGHSIACMPGRFEGLEGLIWADYLERSDAVPVLNDANSALLGEVWLGAARGAKNVILLTLGTGVGGAAMVDGRLLHGHTGKAGHLGHVSLNPDAAADICRTPGSLENAIGNLNIGERSHGHFSTTQELIRAHEQGDAFATEVWLKSVKALAAAIASFGNVLDPEIAIIGGGISRSGDTLFRPLRAFLDDMEWRAGGAAMRVVPARLGELAGAYGAAFNARSAGSA